MNRVGAKSTVGPQLVPPTAAPHRMLFWVAGIPLIWPSLALVVPVALGTTPQCEGVTLHSTWNLPHEKKNRALASSPLLMMARSSFSRMMWLAELKVSVKVPPFLFWTLGICLPLIDRM